MKVYIDGRYYEKSEAKVSVFDHGLLYGDGVFEGIRAYNGRIFKLEEHVRRLFESAKGLVIDPIWSEEEIEKIIVESVRINELRDSYIRVVLTRGVGDLGLDPRKCSKPSLIVIVDRIELYPEKFYTTGLEVITSSLRRTGGDQLNPNIKSLNYLISVMARAEATRANCQEAILLNPQGYVAECSGDNIFCIYQGKVTTPPPWAGILKGITRETAIELLRNQLGVEVMEDVFTTFLVYHSDEVFLTGTGAEIIPVIKADGRIIGSGKAGPITTRLIHAFREYARTSGVPVFEEGKESSRPRNKKHDVQPVQ